MQQSPPAVAAAASDSEAFRLQMPVVVFEKADAPEQQRKRIAGIISTEGLDRQNERLIQDGLDFSPFLSEGHYTNEHTKGDVLDIVGYPDKVQKFQAGEKLPNGQTCPHACTWSEGYLVGNRGEQIYQLAKDLQGTPRRLAFSVEGSIHRRDLDDPNKVLAATIRHCAITGSPVNQDTGLELLLRSLSAVPDAKPLSLAEQAARANSASAQLASLSETSETAADGATAKAYTIGSPPAGSTTPTPNVPLSGEGMGQAFMVQMKQVATRMARQAKRKRPAAAQKTSKSARQGRPSPDKAPCREASISLNRQGALDYLRKAAPGLTPATAHAVYLTARALSALGH